MKVYREPPRKKFIAKSILLLEDEAIRAICLKIELKQAGDAVYKVIASGEDPSVIFRQSAGH